MPDRNRYSTVTGPVAGSDSEIVQLRKFGSAPVVFSKFDAPETFTVGCASPPASSSRISAAPIDTTSTDAGVSKLSENSSVGSISVSPKTGTVTEAEVWPAAKLSVPVVAA